MQTLYLMRHAHAVSEYEECCRPLSNRGQAQTRAMGEHFRARDAIGTSVIWHSPLERARQTACLFNRCAGLEASSQEVDGLLPFDEVGETAQRLFRFDGPLLLVGHEPHLGCLVSHLISGSDDLPLIDFKKGGICCLKRTDNRLWTINWYLTPRTVLKSRGDLDPAS